MPTPSRPLPHLTRLTGAGGSESTPLEACPPAPMHYTTCQRCEWRYIQDAGGPIVALLAHVARFRRCPYCGSVMNGTLCPRCDARYEVAS